METEKTSSNTMQPQLSNRSIPHSKRNHKDLIFRMYFNDAGRLLQLYNAWHHSHHTDLSNFTFTTLENAVYLNYKNDLSFVFDFRLNLYEHQSTINPNIPLRMLFYVSSVLQKLTKDEDLYLRKIVKIPEPQFVVLYNGEEDAPARWSHRLSEQYEQKSSNQQLELVVDVVNINADVNDDLLQDCKPLWEYAQLVKRIRENRKNGEEADAAVRNAVDSCIHDGIMSDFLKENKAEVIAMGVFEYDEEMHLKNVREEGKTEGIAEGKAVGIAEGKLELLTTLVKDGILTVQDAAKRADLTEAVFRKKWILSKCSRNSDSTHGIDDKEGLVK